MTLHNTCTNDKKKRQLCPACLFWDPRPEEGSGPGMGYCSKRDIVTLIRCSCELYQEATKTRVDARNRALYGQIDEGMGEEE